MQIEIYGQLVNGKRCQWCSKAMKFCEERKLPFTYRDMTKDTALQAEFTRRTNDAKSVPQILVGDYIIGGFKELLAVHKAGILQQLIGGN